MQTHQPPKSTDNASQPVEQFIVQVALPVPLPRLFDYLWTPQISLKVPAQGTRVRVSFGAREMVGVVWAQQTSSDVPTHKLKPLLEVLDEHAWLAEGTRALLEWASAYYHHPLGEVIASALPRSLRMGKAAELEKTYVWQLSDAAREISLSTLSRAPKQKQVLQTLQQQSDALSREALQALGVDSALFRTFKDKQWLRPIEAMQSTPKATSASLTLNVEQQHALDEILSATDQFKSFLLEGVTGSGKTEVYLQAIAQMLKQGKQALVLVPEIGLTPQTLARFQARLETRIVALHSGLTDKERTQHWLQAVMGQAQVVIGTRMAVFTPMPNLGLIILDESHDSSFKQQEGFKYSARDLAVVRAHQANIPVVLGSATPMLESVFNAHYKKYHHLTLNTRAGQAQLPTFQLVDIRGQRLQSGLSNTLVELMQKHLQCNGQVLLFLNRRGFAPTLMCHACGWVAMCEQCDKPMTVHQRARQVQCHHCASQKRLETDCPKCQSAQLMALGLGTERVEQQLLSLFPDKHVLRIDRDTTQKKGQLQALLGKADAHGADILVGTQMLAKGHHFKNLSLVAVLDADSGLFSSDFRATEHMGQLLTQVAGRAGRAEKQGTVVVQTRHPEHPLLQLILQSDYQAFCKALLAERQQAALPPYQYFALLSAESPEVGLAQDFLKTVKQTFEAQQVDTVFAMGPVTAPMQKRAGFFRLQLLLQSANRNALQSSLTSLHAILYASKWPARLRWSLDVDPVDMF